MQGVQMGEWARFAVLGMVRIIPRGYEANSALLVQPQGWVGIG